MKLTLPYPPSANRMWRSFGGATVIAGEALAYKREAGWLARAAGVTPLEGDVVLTLHVYRPRRTGDLDNRVKLLIDSLNGIAWDDDAQIVQIHAFRHDDKRNPRVEVEIEALSTAPNQQEQS